MSRGHDTTMLFLDEAAELPQPLAHRRKQKMSQDTQQCMIICLSVVTLVGVIFLGSYHVRKVGQTITLAQMEKGHVKCRNLDGNNGWNPPERCRAK